MKKAKISFLLAILLLGLVLMSCIPGQGQPAKGWAGTAFRDGIIYAGSADGKVVAINASSRTQLWSYAVSIPSGGISCGPSTVAAALYSTPVIHGDLVYIGTYGAQGGRVYSLTAERGVDRWVYPRAGEAYIGSIVGSPVIRNETLYVSSSDGAVYALDTRHGDFRWRSETLADKLWTSPAVVGDTLYVSTFEGHIHALSAETGGLSDWSFKLEAGFASSPVAYEGTIYVGSFDNSLYAIRIGDNEPLWTFAGRQWFWATPLVHEGVVYAGCLDGKFYAVDAATGEKLWEFDAGKPIVSSPVLMGSVLVLANESGTVHAFDLNAEAKDEAVPAKTIQIGAAVRSSFCAHAGMVYIRGEDNKVYVVDIDQGWVSWEYPLTTEG